MTIKLSKGLKLRVLKKVKIKDNDYNRPGPGHLDPGSILFVSSSPTRLSDVPFKLLQGSGEYLSRGLTQDKLYPILPDPSGSSYQSFFFAQTHSTKSPYDWGTVSSEYYEVIHD
jgi:hypothetical protein